LRGDCHYPPLTWLLLVLDVILVLFSYFGSLASFIVRSPPPECGFTFLRRDIYPMLLALLVGVPFELCGLLWSLWLLRLPNPYLGLICPVRTVVRRCHRLLQWFISFFGFFFGAWSCWFSGCGDPVLRTWNRVVGTCRSCGSGLPWRIPIFGAVLYWSSKPCFCLRSPLRRKRFHGWSRSPCSLQYLVLDSSCTYFPCGGLAT
jgi:hypothetical protein